MSVITPRSPVLTGCTIPGCFLVAPLPSLPLPACLAFVHVSCTFSENALPRERILMAKANVFGPLPAGRTHYGGEFAKHRGTCVYLASAKIFARADMTKEEIRANLA